MRKGIRISGALALLSLLLALACGYMWWRSYAQGGFELSVRKGRAAGIAADRGWFALFHNVARYKDILSPPSIPEMVDGTVLGRSLPLEVHVGAQVYGLAGDDLRYYARTYRSWGVLRYMPPMPYGASDCSDPFQIVTQKLGIGGTEQSAGSYCDVEFPAPLVLGALLILPAAWAVRFLRARRQIADAHARPCANCGYDLRGHAVDSPRCPECGTIHDSRPPQAAPVQVRRFTPWRRAARAAVCLSAAACLFCLYLMFSRTAQGRQFTLSREGLYEIYSCDNTFTLSHAPRLGDRASAWFNLDLSNAWLPFYPGNDDPWRGEYVCWGVGQINEELPTQYVRFSAWWAVALFALAPAWKTARWTSHFRHKTTRPAPHLLHHAP